MSNTQPLSSASKAKSRILHDLSRSEETTDAMMREAIEIITQHIPLHVLEVILASVDLDDKRNRLLELLTKLKDRV